MGTAPVTPQDAGRLARLAAWSQRRHRLAIALWLALLVGITAASQVVAADYRDDHTLPGTQSQELADALSEHGFGHAGGSVQVVLSTRAAWPTRRRATGWNPSWPGQASSPSSTPQPAPHITGRDLPGRDHRLRHSHPRP